MSNTNEIPLSLYKANLELQVKIGKLIQESGRQWLDFGYRLVNDGIAESNAEVDELLQTEDWQKLGGLPAESFWRQIQQRFGDGQAAAQIAVAAQTAFASGLQDAVSAWQKETADALGENPLAASLGNPVWADLLQPWAQSVPAASSAPDKPQAKKTTARGSR